MDSFFNLANSLVLVARCVAMESVDLRGPRPPTQYLMEQIHNWVNGSYGSVIASTSLCADACLMLSMMYPQTFGVGENMVLPVWAEAVPALQRRLKEQKETGVPQDGALLERLDLPEELVEQGRTWWKAFVREEGGVWNNGPLGELLDLLHDHNGSHDVSRARYAEVRDKLERSVQAAWLVASPDGVAPPPEGHPASEASEPKRVRRPIIDPVFVGNEKRGVLQRGCLVGIKPHQLRQVCTLAMGAHLPGVSCQVSRNEGGCLRWNTFPLLPRS